MGTLKKIWLEAQTRSLEELSVGLEHILEQAEANKSKIDPEDFFTGVQAANVLMSERLVSICEAVFVSQSTRWRWMNKQSRPPQKKMKHILREIAEQAPERIEELKLSIT